MNTARCVYVSMYCSILLSVIASYSLQLHVIGTQFLKHLDEFIHLLLALHLVLPGADIDTAGTYFVCADNELETALDEKIYCCNKEGIV